MPDPVFTPFSLQHFWVLIVGLSAIAAALVLGRRGGGTERIVRHVLAFLCFAIFPLTLWAWSRVMRDTDFGNFVPLHLCDLAALLAGIALLTRNPTCILLTYFWGLAGTIQGILTPAIDIGFPHPAFISFFLHHFVVVGVALYFPIVWKWRIERPFWSAPVRAFCWLNVYLVVALAANQLLDTNFGFLARKPANPSLLDHLGPHPVYIFWLELIALAIFLILALPLRRKPAQGRLT